MTERAVGERLDVFLDGGAVHRGVEVRVTDQALELVGRAFPLDSVFWISRRAGLLIFFGQEFTAAIKGPRSDLETLAHAVEGADHRERQQAVLRPFSPEVVVCAAGCAVSGEIREVAVLGLHVAVVTQRGIHLISRERHRHLSWPARVVESGASERSGRRGLELTSEDGRLRLMYLFPEEVAAVERVADREPPPTRADAGSATALELFARGEVAHPPPAALPEFRASAETLQKVARQRASALAAEIHSAELGEAFFEALFRELGEIALGPLMLRRSAAAAAGSLSRAAEAMDARRLEADTEAAVSAACDRMFAIYDRELRERVGDRRLAEEDREAVSVSADLRTAIKLRLRRRVQGLGPLFKRLSASQRTMVEQLRRFESGPPDGDTGEVEIAAERWRATLRSLDRAYGAVWRGLLQEIADVWSERLGPALARADALPRRRVPEWLWLGLLALAALLSGALLVILL